LKASADFLHSNETMMLFRMSPGSRVEGIALPAAGEVPLDGVARLVIAGCKACVLLATADVAVNGLPALPAVVLAERDEIRAAGQTYYLAAERAAAVKFAPGDSKACCARCKSVLAAGQQVVFCPSCRSVHHEECWGYAPRCAGCDREVSGEWGPE
jgi:RING finger family protein